MRRLASRETWDGLRLKKEHIIGWRLAASDLQVVLNRVNMKQSHGVYRGLGEEGSRRCFLNANQCFTVLQKTSFRSQNCNLAKVTIHPNPN